MPFGSVHGRHLAALLLAVFVFGCGEQSAQSALHPAGPAAAEIARIWWIMFAAFTAVFLLVMALVFDALVRRPSGATGPELEGNEGAAPYFGRTGFIVAGGVVLPVVILTPLYLLSLKTSASLRSSEGGVVIRVVGHMWWWEVRYPEQGIVTANEIRIPAGKPVQLELTSADVIHSFWVPRLHGKRDLIPGRLNRFSIQADEPGVYRGQCAEYCGTQHANMAFEVVALPQHEFDAWLAGRASPRPEPDTAARRRGRDVFLASGCVQCHAIRGTRAGGNAGPDLTHLANRRTIGGGMLANTRGNLAGWISNPQTIKPGVKMPRTYLAPDDLEALVTYLESLQ